MSYSGSLALKTAAIANGQTVSSVVYLGDKVPVALQMPAALTSTTVSFQGSYDGVTYQAVNVGGSAYTEAVAPSVNVALDPTALAGYRFLIVVAGSAEGGARSIGVMCRRGDK